MCRFVKISLCSFVLWGSIIEGVPKEIQAALELQNTAIKDMNKHTLELYPTIKSVSWGDPIWYPPEKQADYAGYAFRLVVIGSEYKDHLLVEVIALTGEGLFGARLQQRYEIVHGKLGEDLYAISIIKWESPTGVKVRVDRNTGTACYILSLSTDSSKVIVQPCEE